MAYQYAYESYNTKAEVEAAVVALKARLDNNPTDWVEVSLLSGSEEDGWIIPVEHLTDEEINSLDPSSYYSVSEIHGSNSFVGLTGTETTAKIAEFRRNYARFKMANIITETYNPTNEDMSGYV